MRSSITTMPCFPSPGPGAASPLVIRTQAMHASSNTIPKKERPPSPGEAGTLLLNSNIVRIFPLPGRANFQVRLDAQNSLNRQHFGNPGLNPTSTEFGRVTSNANTEPRFLVLIGKITF